MLFDTNLRFVDFDKGNIIINSVHCILGMFDLFDNVEHEFSTFSQIDFS